MTILSDLMATVGKTEIVLLAAFLKALEDDATVKVAEAEMSENGA